MKPKDITQCRGRTQLYFWSDGDPNSRLCWRLKSACLSMNGWNILLWLAQRLCVLARDYLKRGCVKVPKRHCWVFFAALEMEKIKQLPTLPGISENPSLVGLLRVEEQLVSITTTMVHQHQYHTNWDFLIPTHQLIPWLEGQGVISSYFILYLKGLLTVSMKDMVLVYHWNNFRHFQKFTHLMYKCNNRKKCQPEFWKFWITCSR